MRWATAAVVSAAALFAGAGLAVGDVGQWPMPRHDNRLSGHAPGKASMTKPPVRLTRYDCGNARPDWVFTHDVDGDDEAEILYPGSDGTKVVTATGKVKWIGPRAMPIMVADFDGNGTLEVLFDGPALYDGQSGKLLWKSKVPGVPRFRIHAGKFFKDSNAFQIVLVSRVGTDHTAYVYDFSSGAASPDKKWSRKFNTSNLPDECTSAAGFLRGNEDPILAVGIFGGLIVLRLTDGSEVFRFAWDVHGEQLPNYGQIVIADVLGDAKNEFIFLNDILSQQLAVVQYEDGAGNLVWNESFGYWPPLGKVGLHISHNSFADVDGDGSPDIVVSVWQKNLWEMQIREAATGAIKFKAPRLVVHDTVDLDGDGSREILTSMEPKFVLRDVTGLVPSRGSVLAKSEIARISTSRYMFRPAFANPVGRGGRHVYNRVVVTGDCDQDGVQEFVYADCTKGNQQPNSFTAVGFTREGVWSAKGSWPAVKPGNFRLLALDDLNGDGIADAVTCNARGQFFNRGIQHKSRNLGGFQADSDFRSSPVVANLDRQGRNEIIIPTPADHVQALEYDPAAKKIEKRWEVDGRGFSASGDLGPSVVVTDVKPDDKLEVLVAARKIPTLVAVYAIAHDARIRWRCPLPWSTWTEVWPRIDRAAVGKFSGRDYDDLYVACRRVASGFTAHTSYGVLTEFGEIQWRNIGLSDAFPANSLAPSGLASVYDLNGDKKDDIFLNNLDLICCLDGNTGRVLQEPKTFNQLFGGKKISRTAYGSVIPINIVGDEKPELLCVANVGAFGLLTRDRRPLWYVDLPGDGETPQVHPGLADVDGDGKIEIGLPVGGEFHCYDATSGKLEWKLTGDDGRTDVGRTDVATADIDGDGKPEFLLCGKKDLIAIEPHGDGGRILWRVEVGPGPASPVIANVDDDDDLEILVSARGGHLHLFDAAK